MVSKKHKRSGTTIPSILQQIPSPPKQLYCLGNDNLDGLLAKPRVAIIGSRKVTPYGKAVTERLASELATRGVVIISGLAIGVDGLAHQACVQAGGQTIAVLPCGLDAVYPRSHYHLAQEIVRSGGVLISEYPDKTEPFKTNFIARNRLVSGLADALLITEAAEKSGTLHTANFALEQGKPVLAVPGNITSQQSRGTNNLIKAGAALVTDTADVLEVLGISTPSLNQEIIANTAEEKLLLELIQQGISDGHELLRASELAAAQFGQTLTMLEITGRIKPLGNNHWDIL